MLIFPSAEWVAAWVSSTNDDADFRAAGQGWVGTVGVVVQDGPKGRPSFIRLNGREGRWSSYSVLKAPDPASVERIRLTARYAVWQQVIRQELNPIRGVLQGRVIVRGHLPDLLRYRGAILVMCENAGRMDTTFPVA
ncbi:hypothetical protein [Nakamurella sp.]|uniref:hypothetical protein n=1 Tax=Nakamurella sp. TaxID=1869182 RepID=UPI003783CDB4